MGLEGKRGITRAAIFGGKSGLKEFWAFCCRWEIYQWVWELRRGSREKGEEGGLFVFFNGDDFFFTFCLAFFSGKRCPLGPTPVSPYLLCFFFKK